MLNDDELFAISFQFETNDLIRRHELKLWVRLWALYTAPQRLLGGWRA